MHSLSKAALTLLCAFPQAATAASVLTYHNSNTRQGAYIEPALTRAAAAGVKLDTGFNGSVKWARLCPAAVLARGRQACRSNRSDGKQSGERPE